MTRAELRQAALGRLAATSARRGHRIALALLRDRAEAEDAVQEALARACRDWERLREPEALAGWFFRVLTNGCLRALRRRRLGRVLAELWPSTQKPSEINVVDDSAKLLAAVERLPARQRAALVLRYGQDLAVEEIAAMLGVGAGTVKTHLVRGLARLRVHFGVEGGER